MNVVETVVVVAVLLVILYLVLRWMFGGSAPLTAQKSGTMRTRIPASKLANSNHSSNYAYSIWYYADDWNYRYGEHKTLIDREGERQSGPCPKIYLGAHENDVYVEIATYPAHSQGSHEHGPPHGKHNKHVSVVRNFPLQKWVNLTISVYGRTLDIYLNGKLVQSDVLNGVVRPCDEAPLTVTGDGGFKGWTSYLRYWPHALNPQQAYNVYRDGYSGGWGNILNFFDKFRIKISLVENNRESGSLEI